MANALAWINAGSPWTPASDPNLIGWWKADSLGLADGTSVDSWADSSGNGNTSTQTGTARPVYHTNIQNGLPAVLFNPANNQFMTNNMSTSTKPWTVAGAIWSSNYAQNICILGTGGGAAGLEVRISGTHLDILKQGSVDLGSDTTVLSSGNWYVFSITYDGSGNFAYTVNGVAGATGTNNQTFSSDVSQLGKSTSEFYDGYIGELFKSSAVVSATLIDGYLNGRWATH